MSIIRMIGDMLHLAAIVILLTKMLRGRSAAGISLKSMQCFALVFCTRYLDIFVSYLGLYNFVMKLFFIGTSLHICHLLKYRLPWKASYDKENDTFRIRYLLAPCFLLALIWHGAVRRSLILDICWAFSQYLEAVAILPQIFLLEYTDRYDALTSHYLFCLGAYRLVYIVHWICRYMLYGKFNAITVVCGLVQTLLYADFFYHYIIQVARRAKQKYDLAR